MNKQRRARIKEVVDQISVLCQELEELRDEEQEYIDNMPENLQCSDKYEIAEEAVSNLDSAIDNITEAIDYANEASA